MGNDPSPLYITTAAGMLGLSAGMKVKFSLGSKEVQSYRNWLMLCVPRSLDPESLIILFENDHIHKHKTAEEL
ncbi:S-locus lectin protein kinase family protein [Prunus dulcis]|uniref:S-locus lectin protein kinase family protein n=1 Tax=Prunus dulcis TaxID=3755 RepID=A0A4Y1RK50_PRUDU|nr:S-locus lectin protein kinase family protein [Prunus dulcis]